MKLLRTVCIALLLLSISYIVMGQNSDLIDDFVGIVAARLAASAMTSELVFGIRIPTLYKKMAWEIKDPILRPTAKRPDALIVEQVDGWKIAANKTAVTRMYLTFLPDLNFAHNSRLDKADNFRAFTNQTAPTELTVSPDANQVRSYTNPFTATFFNCQEMAMLVLTFTAEKNDDYEVTVTFEKGIIGMDYLDRLENKTFTFHIYGRRVQREGRAIWIHPAILHEQFFKAQRYDIVDYPTPIHYHRLYSINIKRLGGVAQMNIKLHSLKAYYITTTDWNEYHSNYLSTETEMSAAGAATQ